MSSTDTERPKVELFLQKINQDMIRTRTAGLPPQADCAVYASWKKSCCILDFSLAREKEGDSIPQPGVILRKEPDGGMMWNARTGAVYKLNEVAYHAILDIEHGLSDREVARRSDLPLKSVQALFKKLQRIA